VNVSSSVQAEIKSWQADVNIDTEDVTRLSASGFRDRIITNTDMTGSFVGNTYISNIGVGAKRTVVLKSQSTTAAKAPQFTFRAIIKPSGNIPATGAAEWTYNFESDGPITIALS